MLSKLEVEIMRRTSNNYGSFQYLPDIANLHIFSFLSHSELGTVARTSKAINHIANDDYLWKKRIKEDFGVNLIGAILYTPAKSIYKGLLCLRQLMNNHPTLFTIYPKSTEDFYHIAAMEMNWNVDKMWEEMENALAVESVWRKVNILLSEKTIKICVSARNRFRLRFLAMTEQYETVKAIVASLKQHSKYFDKDGALLEIVANQASFSMTDFFVNDMGFDITEEVHAAAIASGNLDYLIYLENLGETMYDSEEQESEEYSEESTEEYSDSELQELNMAAKHSNPAMLQHIIKTFDLSELPSSHIREAANWAISGNNIQTFEYLNQLYNRRYNTKDDWQEDSYKYSLYGCLYQMKAICETADNISVEMLEHLFRFKPFVGGSSLDDNGWFMHRINEYCHIFFLRNDETVAYLNKKFSDAYRDLFLRMNGDLQINMASVPEKLHGFDVMLEIAAEAGNDSLFYEALRLMYLNYARPGYVKKIKEIIEANPDKFRPDRPLPETKWYLGYNEQYFPDDVPLEVIKIGDLVHPFNFDELEHKNEYNRAISILIKLIRANHDAAVDYLINKYHPECIDAYWQAAFAAEGTQVLKLIIDKYGMPPEKQMDNYFLIAFKHGRVPVLQLIFDNLGYVLNKELIPELFDQYHKRKAIESLCYLVLKSPQREVFLVDEKSWQEYMDIIYRTSNWHRITTNDGEDEYTFTDFHQALATLKTSLRNPLSDFLTSDVTMKSKSAYEHIPFLSHRMEKPTGTRKILLDFYRYLKKDDWDLSLELDEIPRQGTHGRQLFLYFSQYGKDCGYEYNPPEEILKEHGIISTDEENHDSRGWCLTM